MSFEWRGWVENLSKLIVSSFNDIRSHPGVVLALIKLTSLWPGSSILVKCVTSPDNRGWAQPYQLSWYSSWASLCSLVISRTNCKLDLAFSCGALNSKVCKRTNDVRIPVKELCSWQFKGSIRSRRLLSECDHSDLNFCIKLPIHMVCSCKFVRADIYVWVVLWWIYQSIDGPILN